MSKKALTISLIILAYNEEDQLGACLDAVAAQTVMPDEVIVVDNNSTDATVAIARSYPFVKLIHESRQGMIPARNKGFAVAKGDILARIDADAQIVPEWTARLHELFADEAITAASGPALAHNFEHGQTYSTFWSRCYLLWAHAYFGTPVVWGANMALRRSAWQEIAAMTNPDDRQVHEDQDISLLLAARGGSIRNDAKLIIKTDTTTTISWEKYAEYMQRRWQTKRYHVQQGSYGVIPLWAPHKRALVYTIGFMPLGIWTSYSFLMYLARKARKPFEELAYDGQ